MGFTTRPELRGTFGMVASTHWLGSAVGMAILERGGNAFDAAVAAGLVLQVVEPHLNGPGGEVPIVFYDASSDEVSVVDGQGVAPAAADARAFADLGVDVVPGTGLLAACVPGAFGAWMLLLRDRGRLRLRDVMELAIGYAEHGFPVLERVRATIASVEAMFRSEWPTSAAAWLTPQGPPRAGMVWRNTALARTYHRILSEAEAAGQERALQIEGARRAFYEGFVAEELDAFCAMPFLDSSGSRHAGLLTGDDLGRWSASYEGPVHLDYGAYRVFKTQPWSQGPVFLQQLALLDGFDLSSMGHNSADYIHTIVECAKLAFADREAYYGDPRIVEVPVAELLTPSYAAERRALVTGEASLELRPGSPSGAIPLLPELPRGAAAATGAGEPTIERDGTTWGDTCHVDVVDAEGNMVSATPSGGWLQSSPVVPELGFPLGTRAQMFWLQEGLPNSLAPGKRPRTTLTPSLAFRDGEPYIAFGTPGGDSQDQWSLNFFLAHVHFELDLQAAIDAATWHSTHFPSSFYPRDAHPGQLLIEARVGRDVVEELERRGHEVVIEGPWSLGRVSAAGRDARAGVLKAAANPRGMQGYAVGR